MANTVNRIIESIGDIDIQNTTGAYYGGIGDTTFPNFPFPGAGWGSTVGNDTYFAGISNTGAVTSIVGVINTVTGDSLGTFAQPTQIGMNFNDVSGGTGNTGITITTGLTMFVNVAGNLTTRWFQQGTDQSIIEIRNNSAVAGETTELRFQELASNGNEFVGFKAPDTIAADVMWTLPDADGTANQVLTTDGSAALAWATLSTTRMQDGDGDTVIDVDLGGANNNTIIMQVGNNTAGDYDVSNDILQMSVNGIFMTSPAGGTGNDVAGVDVNITTGDGDTTGQGGSFTVDAGDGGGLGSGGAIAITAGDGGLAAGNGGAVTIQSGAGNSSGADSGDVNIIAATSSNTGAGGTVLIQSGISSLGTGGDIRFDLGEGGGGINGSIVIDPVGPAAGETAEMHFLELAANGTDYVGFKAPDLITTPQVWTLPAVDGAANTFLQTDGSGNLGWAAPATPGVIVYRDNATVVANTNLETDLLLYEVPANQLVTGGPNALRIKMNLAYLNDSGSNDAHILRVYYGASLMYEDTSSNLGTNTAERAMNYDFVVGNRGAATNVQYVSGQVHHGVAAPGATVGYGNLATDEIGGEAPIMGAGSEDSTVIQNLRVTIQFTNASTNLSMSVLWADITLV